MTLILLGVYGVIVCIAVLVIILIRGKQFSPGSAIDESQNGDIFSAIGNWKKASLAKKPWNMKYETYKAISTICACVFAVIGFVLTGNLLKTAALTMFGVLIPEIIVLFQSNQQKSKFEERYARGLRQLAASLKSGLSIHQAISDVCQSPFVHDDIRHEFQQLDADLKLGIPIKEGFERFAKRVDCVDAKDVAIAIGMQSKVGGREAQVVETIAQNISDRLMLRKEVNSLFAGSNTTILMLDIIPFAVIVLMLLFGQTFMQPYFEDPTLLTVLIFLIVFMAVGTIITRKIVKQMKVEFGL